jgi:class 3 adenylate cyclase
MIGVIQRHRGIIVDFFGDGMLVFFDPVEKPIDPVIEAAVQCALRMQEAMTALNALMRAQSLPEFLMGIAVHAGDVVVGNIGSETRAKYGIVGSAVNMTHRIQTHARGGEVVVSRAVYDEVKDAVSVVRSFETHLKGLREPQQLYVLQGIEASPPLPPGDSEDGLRLGKS